MLEDIHSRRQAAEQKAQAQHRKELARHEQKVRAQQEQARARHEKALAKRTARLTKLRRERERARAERRWWAWLQACVLAWRTRLRRPPPPVLHPRRIPRPPVPPVMPHLGTDEEEILAAGMTGEQKVTAELGAALRDDWVLLRGYRNRRGEIDHVLLGPRGIFTIEVKHRNATVHIDGDEWRFHKYDRYGNMVEQGWITDRRGRSPSVQLNESTAELERFLRSRGHPVQARRVVVLTHPRSALGQHRNVTVDLVATSTDRLIKLVTGSPPVLDKAQVLDLQRLIVRDHQFNQRRSGH